MADQIQPALTPEEWRRARQHAKTAEAEGYDPRWVMMERRPEAAVALGNAMLPDADPRKITRAMVDGLREAATEAPWSPDDPDVFLWNVADVLEAYLPPK